MRGSRPLHYAVVLAPLLAGLAAGAGAAWPTPHRSACSPGWSVVASPNDGTGDVLMGVAAAAVDDVWAVGSYEVGGQIARPLALHWTGAAWWKVDAPNATSGDNLLNGVAALATGEAYAVGSASSLGTSQPLIEHWNETAWSIVPGLPNPGPTVSQLFGVAATSASDVWAVGNYQDTNGQSQPLVLHFDGTTWTLVPTPSTGTGSSYLRAVTATSTSDAWTVGEYSNGGRLRTLIEHWDGTAWTISPSPNPGAGNNILTDTSAHSPTDAWAVGEANQTSSLQPLVEHWNGSTWATVSTTTLAIPDGRLYSVQATGARALQTVGSQFDASAEQNDPLALERHNATWTTQQTWPTTGDTSLSAITQTPSGDLWAAGIRTGHTLLEHQCST